MHFLRNQLFGIHAHTWNIRYRHVNCLGGQGLTASVGANIVLGDWSTSKFTCRAAGKKWKCICWSVFWKRHGRMYVCTLPSQKWLLQWFICWKRIFVIAQVIKWLGMYGCMHNAFFAAVHANPALFIYSTKIPDFEVSFFSCPILDMCGLEQNVQGVMSETKHLMTPCSFDD